MSGLRRGATSAGFTLIELSVVLIIVGVITGMAMQSGVGVLATARLSATTQKMAAIEQALMAFRNANNRLPCPGNFSILAGATNYGIEAGGGMSCGTGTGVGSGACTGTLPVAVGTCAVGATIVPFASYSAAGVTNTGNTGAEGTVPVATLGLPNDFMFDGWGNKFRYAVDISATASNYFSSVPIGCTAGAITITDSSEDTSATASPPARSTAALYALVSHGPNGHGAYGNSTSMKNGGSRNANELTNCHCTSTAGAGTYAPTYVQADPTDSTSGNASTTFDDIVTYKERWQLQNGYDVAGTSCGANKYIYAGDYSGHVQVYDTSGNYKLTIDNSAIGGVGGVAVDSSGNVWVSDGGPHVEKYSSNGTWLAQLGGGNVSCTLGGGPCLCTTGQTSCGSSTGSTPGLFYNAEFLYLDSSGNLYVPDVGKNLGTSGTESQIQVFDKNGNYLRTIGNGSICNVDGVAVDSSNNVWAADYYCNNLLKCSNTSGGSCSIVYNPPNSPQLSGLAIDASGTIWVADNAPGNIGGALLKFTSSGSYVTDYIPSGTGNGDSSDINDVKADSSGNIWVVNQNLNTIAKFNSSGTWQENIAGTSSTCSNCLCTGPSTCPSSSGTGNGQLNQPNNLAIGTR